MKIKVLILLEYYLPGYKAGGALRSIANLVAQMGEDIDFNIITKDRDSGDEEPYPDIKVDQWNNIGAARVFYMSPENQTSRRLASIINETEHDVLYLNSFFDPVFTFRPLLARIFNKITKKPIVIAPRGEFSKGALAVKRLKKHIYIIVTKLLGLYHQLLWQASSEYEARDIYKAFAVRRSEIVVAPNVLPFVSKSECDIKVEMEELTEPLKVCFLSRISPKKNLDFALNVVEQLKVPIVFDIYGPIDDAQYWETCKSYIEKMSPSKAVSYKGNVEHNLVIDIFRKYALFFFPTRGENFGHVILESMLAGTPVLLSDATPWRNLEKLGLGWDLSLDKPDAFVEAIETLAFKNLDESLKLRDRVRNHAIQKCLDSETLKANKNMFLRAADSLVK